MSFSKSDIKKVEEKSDIRLLIPNLKGSGASRYCKCSACNKAGKNKGLIVTHKEEKGKVTNIAKCFSCNFTITGAIAAVQHYDGKTFPEAVEYLARLNNIQLSGTGPKKKLTPDEAKIRGSFCERQLLNSGLTISDIMVKVPVKGTDDYMLEPAFTKGGADNMVHHINYVDDEMLINYYDLEGNRMYFVPKAKPSAKPRPYIRVRWSNPAAHSYDGKEIKYQTPKGAPCAFYIPQAIRDKYKNEEQIDTLIIQEGEKKAEKACKHGIPSLGIQGIYNIGNAETGLMKELQYIVQRCKVRNIVLLMDSDWDHLNKNLHADSAIDARPNQFSRAVIKFQNYVKTLHKLQLHVDVFFGYIKNNEKGDKGIDDLLVNTLNFKESELKKDIDDTINSHNGEGQYVDIHKITTKTEHQIRDFWKLNSSKEFFEKYRSQIIELPSFRFGYILYIIEDGKIKEAARNAAEKNFWSVSISEKEKKTVDFNYKAALDFLEANKFHKVHTAELRKGEYKLVKIDDYIVSETSGTEIRDFIYDYVARSTKDEEVLNMFISRLENLMGAGKLERLTAIEDEFNLPEPWTQKFFFKNCAIKITEKGIEEEAITQNVWEESLIKRKFKRVPIFEYLENKGGWFDIKLTSDGERCEYFEMIKCASNFWKGREEFLSDDDMNTAVLHIVNKITAIGFLLNSWKPRSEQICIVAMDAKMDEVGASNGRSGKSMIAQALEKIINVTTVDGKKSKNDDDFIYSLVTPKTRIVFLDDVNVNFDFKNFYSALTGNLQINPKTGARFEIKYDFAPKFLLTTNHAINDQSDSGKDRRVLLAFSNYFTKDYTPKEHFGHMLFDEWDEEQWNLFDNFMMECVMYYLRSMAQGWTKPGRGVVPPPMEQLKKRELRQQMGEAFLQWAETFFDESNSVLNYRLSRKEMFDKYHQAFTSAKESIRASDFRKRMIAYCQYKGYHFCPDGRSIEGERFSDWRSYHQGETFIGESYKSNSVEYWRIATDEFSTQQPW